MELRYISEEDVQLTNYEENPNSFSTWIPHEMSMLMVELMPISERCRIRGTCLYVPYTQTEIEYLNGNIDLDNDESIRLAFTCKMIKDGYKVKGYEYIGTMDNFYVKWSSMIILSDATDEQIEHIIKILYEDNEILYWFLDGIVINGKLMTSYIEKITDRDIIHAAVNYGPNALNMLYQRYNDDRIVRYFEMEF